MPTFASKFLKGPSVLQGDSGGGYLLLENGLYFLRGIVSLKQPTSTAIAAFTDLADHIDWILATRNAIEQEILTKETKIPQKQTPNGKQLNNKHPWMVRFVTKISEKQEIHLMLKTFWY